MIQDLLKPIRPKMEQAIDYFKNELKSIRTGRATPSLVEKIEIDYYGSRTPLIQVAAITIPDPRTILIQPWEKSILSEIEKAIATSDLGVSPVNDGNSIRVKIPSLTEESREQLVKIACEQEEKVKVSLRSIRHEVLDMIKKEQKKGKISEDDLYYAKDELDKMVVAFDKEAADLRHNKEEEIRQI
jgi:ribosome recycling factor